MEEITIKQLNDDQISKALELVWEVFKVYEEPEYPKEGVEEFYKSIHDPNYLSVLQIFGAFREKELVGVIATRNEGSHVALFFVAGSIMGKASAESFLKW